MGFRVPPSAQSSRRSDSTLRSPFFDASCYGHRTHVGRTTTGLASGLNLPGSSGPLTAFLDLAGADRVSVVLLTTGGDHLKLHGLEGESVIATGAAIPVKGSISGRAITERRTVIVDELSKASSVEGPKLINAGLRSVACVPLIGSDGVLGAINMGSHKPNYFYAAGLRRIEALASLLASYVALHQHARRDKQRDSPD